MKAAFLALVALTYLAAIGAVVFVVFAIWTHGPDSARCLGTAFLCVVVAGLAGAAATCMGDER